MSRQVDALLAGIAALSADKADDDTASALRDRHDAAVALAQLDVPLEDPAKVYHPRQIECRRDKESGESVFARALGTTENLARLVDAYGVQIRYNELSRDIEVSVAGRLRDGELARNTNLALVEDLCRINNYPHTQAAGNIQAVAERSAYNPAIDWIRSTPWDGETRIESLFECLTLTDPSKSQISWTLFCKWLRGAAAILCGRASKFEHVLVLVDPTGGIGKTRFFNTLCPSAFQADGVALNVNDKDSILHVVSKWLVELGEIGATFSKSDTEALKAFLSRSFDEVRPPYARAANQYPRRTAFFGSVNNVRFLVDDTNNRRFWPIEVSAVDYQHRVDMQQVWAEALHQVEAGERWHLNPDENRAVGEYNEGFRSMDRVEELILNGYDRGGIPCRYVSASEVLAELGLIGARTGDLRKAGAVLRKLFAHSNRRGVVTYHMPQLISRASALTPARDWRVEYPI